MGDREAGGSRTGSSDPTPSKPALSRRNTWTASGLETHAARMQPRATWRISAPDAPSLNDSPHPAILNQSATLGCVAAGRRDRQVLGAKLQWTAGAGRHLKTGRRCQRSLPTSLCLSLSRALSLSRSCSLSLPPLAQRAPPPRLACRSPVFSPLLLLSACRDGDEPRFGRPGGWEDGRSRQRWVGPYVRAAGKATRWEIGRRGAAE